MYSGLDKRYNWKHATAIGVSVGFALLAGGAFFGPITIAGSAMYTYIFGCVAAGVSAGTGAYGGINTWEWFNPTEAITTKRSLGQGDTYRATATTLTLGHPVLDVFDSFPGLNTSKVMSVGELWFPLNSSDTISKKRDTTNGTHYLEAYLWSYNFTEHLISAAVPPEAMTDAVKSLNAYVTGEEQPAKRSSATWVSYSMYGMNPYLSEVIIDQENTEMNDLAGLLTSTFTEQIQPCGDPECYAAASKGCFSIGDNGTPGVASDVVGEYYLNAYGGIDGECQGG